MKRRQALKAMGAAALVGPHLLANQKRSQTMKKAIQTDKAPKAIGPYSQAIAINDTIFASGQIPIDPNLAKLCDAGSIEGYDNEFIDNVGKAIIKATEKKRTESKCDTG